MKPTRRNALVGIAAGVLAWGAYALFRGLSGSNTLAHSTPKVPTATAAPKLIGVQSAHHFSQVIRTADGTTQTLQIDYLLYLPTRFGKDTTRRHPLLLYLHGASESGSDPRVLRRHGPPKYIEGMRDFPFIMVSPQAPAAIGWQPQFPILKALLANVLASLPVDPRQVYLTGNSMGGNGAWDLARQMPKQFAALIPVAAFYTGRPSDLCVLKDMPIWVIHGEQDDTIPASGADILVTALRECGGNPKYTVLPETAHVETNEIYARTDLYAWLLQHQRARSNMK